MEEATTKKVVVEQESEDDMEKSIAKAMRERVGHFKEQADSLTLEGVRRVLEKDLELETFALDVHKRFIKQCLQECFDGANDKSVSKQSAETVKGIVQPGKVETTDLSEELQSDKKEKDPGSESDEKNRGSPVQGILDGEETAPNDTHEAEGVKMEKSLSEDNIKKALKKRASYFRENSESLTMAGVRRLLEEDLKLDKNALDPYKKLISEQLDEIMQSSGVSEPANGAKTKRVKKESSRKTSSDTSEGSSGSMDSEDEEANEEEVKPKRKNVLKGKPQNSKDLKNRKTPAKETTTSSNKRKRPAEPASEDSDGKDSGNLSEDANSQSSIEEPVKKKSQTSTQVYGKCVEHLKSVIKSCGMSVPPAVYKRAKQAPESKREAALIKELEEILKKEGLSTNPSEKEIKAVKKQKARTKELEGIDLSNIVQSSRRRSTSSFVPPPKPKIPVESDDEEEDEEEDEDDEVDSDDEVDAAADSEGASEDINEDAEDSD